jgi:hypothetical protein
MRTLHSFFDKMPVIADICRYLADKYLEVVVKSLLLISSLWVGLASLTYLSQTLGA